MLAFSLLSTASLRGCQGSQAPVALLAPSEPSSSTSLMQNEDRTDAGPPAECARVTAVL